MIYLKDGNTPLNLAYDDEIVQEANATYQLSFKFPLVDSKWQLLKKETFLVADDLHGEQEFFIGEVKKKNDFVQVYAKQVATLLNYYSIGSLSVDRVAGQTVMTALAGSVKRPCPFTFFSDIMDRHSFNQSDVSVITALSKDNHSIIGQWGGDLIRDKYQVKLLKNGGVETEALFMYKKNLSTYEESSSIEKIYTRIHFKKIIRGTSGGADKTISVTVDSPLISKYSQIYEGNIEVNDQEVTDLASLKKYGQNYYASTLCDIVEDSFEITVKGQDVFLKMFDTVSVFHEKFGVDLRLKISKYRFSPMSKRLKTIGFGKVSRNLGNTVSGMISNAVNQTVSNFELQLQKEIDNANKHFDAEFEKHQTAINDGIETAKAAAVVYADNIRSEIQDKMDSHQNQYQFERQEQDSKIAEILNKANANTNLATEAKRIGTQAKTDAIAEANRLVESAKTLLSNQVSNVVTDLTKTNDSIKLLASKQSIEALSGRLSSTEASLQVQAGQIEQRLTATQVEQAIDAKGFTTMSSVQNVVTETAERFSRTISRTESQLSNIVNRFNTVEESVGSHSRTIAEQGKSISQIVQTSTGLVSRVGNLVDGRNLIYGATKLPKYISSVATDTHLERVGWGDHDGIRINYTQSMSGWLGFRLPLTKKFVRTGDRLAYRIEIAVDVIPENNMVLIQLLDNTSGLRMYYNSSITITSTGNHVFTGFIDIPNTGELNEYSLRFTLTRPGNIVIHKPTIVESDTIPEKFFDNTDYTTEYNRTLVTQLSNSWSVQNINSAGDLISGINLGANGNNRIDGKATHITGQTLIDNAVIKSAMIDKLKTANFESGSVTTSILSSEAVTADKLKVDQALFNKLMANEAYLKQLFAKRAFITQVQSVTVSASKISGGVLTANNGNSTFNLNSGVITMQASPTSWKTTWDANGIAFRGSNNAVWGAMGGDSGGGMGIYMRGDRAFTVVLNHSDNGSTTSYTPIRFKYGEGTTLQFSPNGPSYNLLTLFRTIFSNFQNGTRTYYEMK